MSSILSWLGGLLTALILIAAAASLWSIFRSWRRVRAKNRAIAASDEAARHLLRWTLLDYAVLILFLFGAVLLAADLASVMRDRAAYPYYHFAYLLCGLLYTVISMLFLWFRLMAVLKLLESDRRFAGHDQGEPEHADQAEQGIERGQ